MRIFILTISMFLAGLSWSQEVALSTTVDIGQPLTRLQHLLVDTDTVVAYGQALIGTDDPLQGIFFAKFDTNGVLLDTLFLLDVLGDKLSVDEHWGSIVKTSDGGYAATAAAIGRPSAFLIKLDHSLGIDFVREYHDTVNVSNFDYTVKGAPGGYLLFGSYQQPDAKILGFVRKVDMEGDIEWQKDYGTNPSLIVSRVNDVLVRENGDIVAAVRLSTAFFPFSSNSSRIVVLDSSGNLLNSWQSGVEPEEGVLFQIVNASDNSIMVYGKYKKETVGNTEYFQSTLTKFDSSFEVKWSNRFGEVRTSAAAYTLRGFLKSQDLNWLGIGQKGYWDEEQGEIERGGWVYHFSPEGDSIWGRHIENPFPSDSTSSYLNGGGILSSGSIMAGGSFRMPGDSRAWLVRLACSDSVFCAKPYVSSVKDLEHSNEVIVYPNPATGTLYMSFNPSARFEEVSILDMEGKRHFVQKIRLPVDGLDISQLSKGAYILRAEGPGGYSNTKFVKN